MGKGRDLLVVGRVLDLMVVGIFDNNVLGCFAHVIHSSQGSFMLQFVNPVFHLYKPSLWGLSGLALEFKWQNQDTTLHFKPASFLYTLLSSWNHLLVWTAPSLNLCAVCALCYALGWGWSYRADCVLLLKGSWSSEEHQQIQNRIQDSGILPENSEKALGLQMWVRACQLGRVGKGVLFRGCRRSQIKSVHAGNRWDRQGCMRIPGKETGCMHSSSRGVCGQLLGVAIALLSGAYFSGLRSWKGNKIHSWWKKGLHRADFHLLPPATTAISIATSDNIENSDCQHLLNTPCLPGLVPNSLCAIYF